MKTNPLKLSIVIPAFNEEALLEVNVKEICVYLASHESQYSWELLIINDGSSDGTGEIADELARHNENVYALHHPVNFGFGQALSFGIANSIGDYVVTLDIDLSYDVTHIGSMLAKIKESHAKIVLASPYMQGGTIANVPFVRRTLSILGNRFLSIFARDGLSTLTSIARIYDGPFIRALKLRSNGLDILPEILYKAMVVHAKIEQTPGHLDWGPQLKFGAARISSMRLRSHIKSTLLSGFIFRPFMFFVFPGVLVGLFAVYVNYWMVAHFVEALFAVKESTGEFAVAKAFALGYQSYPHTFVTALLSSMLSIQLVGYGMIALQNKRNFEDLYLLNSVELDKIKVLKNRQHTGTRNRKIDKTALPTSRKSDQNKTVPVETTTD